MKNVELSNVTLETTAVNDLKLDWSPDELSFTGFSFDTVSLNLDDSGVGVKASGTISMSLEGISCAVPSDWMAGLGLGSFKCDLILAGNIDLTTRSSQSSVNLSKLTTSVMGYALSLSDMRFQVDYTNLDNLADSVKTELEKADTGLFNKFWSSQATKGKQVLTNDLKNKSVSLDFASLNLAVSNSIIAIKGGKALTTETSTITGSVSCTWKYSGVALSLKASVAFFGKATSVKGTSDSATDLAKLSSWVGAQAAQLYNPPSNNRTWIRSVGIFLRSHGLAVANTFKAQGYSAVVASQAVDGARQSGAGIVLNLLSKAGYSHSDLANAMRYGMNQLGVPFARLFYTTLRWTYRAVGESMRDVGYTAGEIASGLDWPHHFKCKPEDIAGFLTVHCNCKAGDLDGVSSPNIALIMKHMKSGTSNNGKGFYKPPPPKGKKPLG